MDNVTAAIGRCQQNHDDSRESSNTSPRRRPPQKANTGLSGDPGRGDAEKDKTGNVSAQDQDNCNLTGGRVRGTSLLKLGSPSLF
jgi:hypothetical protein